MTTRAWCMLVVMLAGSTLTSAITNRSKRWPLKLSWRGIKEPQGCIKILKASMLIMLIAKGVTIPSVIKSAITAVKRLYMGWGVKARHHRRVPQKWRTNINHHREITGRAASNMKTRWEILAQKYLEETLWSDRSMMRLRLAPFADFLSVVLKMTPRKVTRCSNGTRRLMKRLRRLAGLLWPSNTGSVGLFVPSEWLWLMEPCRPSSVDSTL